MLGTERPVVRGVTALVALAWAAPVGAQTPTITDADLERARRAQPTLTEQDIANARRQHQGAGTAADELPTPASTPRLDALPQALSTRPLDLQAIARGYRTPGNDGSADAGLQHGPGMMVFVSLSMPRATLDRLLDQAARARATVVLRGFVQGSLRTTVSQVQDLIGQRQIALQIDPPAFDRFAITRVPSVVLVRNGARPVSCASGTCAPPEAFLKVDGDVSLDYALAHMQRAAPAFDADAALFLARLRP